MLELEFLSSIDVVEIPATQNMGMMASPSKLTFSFCHSALSASAVRFLLVHNIMSVLI